MPWEQKPISAPLLDGIEELATSISAITEPVITLLDLATTALEAAQIFFSTTANPTTALANSLIDEVEKLNNDIFGTGVFQLVVQPFDVSGKLTIPGVGQASSIDTDSKLIEIEQTGSSLSLDDFGIPQLTPRKNIDKILQSFDDEGDAERPQFSDNAEVVAFGFLISAPDTVSFSNIIDSLLGVWDLADFRRLLDRVKSTTNTETAGSIPTPSRKPDWDSVRFNSIGFLADTQNELNKQLAFLRGLVGSTDDIINDFLQMVERKIANLKSIIEEFNALINTIKSAFDASGVYFLDIPPGIGGNEYLKEKISDEQFNSSQDSISASVVYVGGGASLASVDAIRKILT